jgi:hypothetical protein
VIGWLGVAQGIRLIRGVPSMAAMALGDTHNTMITNFFRAVGLGLCVVAASLGMPVEWIAVSSVVGEVVALLAAGPLLQWMHGVSKGICWWPGLFLCVASGAAIALQRAILGRASLGLGVGAFVLVIVALQGVFFAAFPDIRREAFAMVRSGVKRIYTSERALIGPRQEPEL